MRAATWRVLSRDARKSSSRPPPPQTPTTNNSPVSRIRWNDRFYARHLWFNDRIERAETTSNNSWQKLLLISVRKFNRRRIVHFIGAKGSPRWKKNYEYWRCFRENRNTYDSGNKLRKESPLVVSILPFGIMDSGLIFHFHPRVGFERYRWHRDDIAAKGLRMGRGRADRTKVLSGENGLAADESGRYHPSDEKSRATPIETFFSHRSYPSHRPPFSSSSSSAI